MTQGPSAAPQLSDFGRAFLDKLRSLTSWTDEPYARQLRDLVLEQQPDEAAHVVGALRQHVKQEQCPLEARVAALYLMSAVLKADGCPSVLTEQLSTAFHEMFKLVWDAAEDTPQMFKLVWDAADDEATRTQLRLIVSYVATNPELRSKVDLEAHITLMTQSTEETELTEATELTELTGATELTELTEATELTEPSKPTAMDAAAAAASQQRALQDITLMLAAKQGHAGIAGEMIKEGADPDAKDKLSGRART
ncbi:hypothetical protein GPECTOR_158g101 [Gonium pectorale]|uniref:CID domain-containing protein n=1 Tax=Gonium pectorale TaxID=33097 RepID=A0A150FXP5_GONPE|nr:hypothetical protein GPECTOR_158g101 [Gonium pectorale]|eukprot:KXZ42347.1 hypothetical protein GPECTOR_158g101 [Gonium pectorale]